MGTTTKDDIQDSNTEEPLDAEELLTEIVMALVTKPEAVSVHEDWYTDGVPYMAIVCARDDVGAVVGYDGKTIKGLREVFSTVGRREGRVLHLDIDASIRDPRYNSRSRKATMAAKKKPGGDDNDDGNRPAWKSASASVLGKDL